ncbi:family S53 protease-like protein [Rhodocollybia butyracea]|uniref:Family S53 protease-like protein n=1 Tax=Rhodocollybia butyracea TaxID=206335 RepID=A0A9P5U324_9AGAR|nr:family S53 protease-like protein [Rhodocollybia butyracea]
MVHLTFYAALLSGIATTIAAPTRRSMVVHESRELPLYFAHAGAPNPDTTLNLRIALTANDRNGLEQKLWDVSTPGSALYGQHLSFDETKAFAAPHPDTVQAVTSWLNENNITSVSTSGAFDEWLKFSVPVSTANSLFNANYQLYTEIGGPTQLTRTLAYSIPADLQQHINLIHPSTDFVRQIKGAKLGGPVPNSNSNTARALAAPASCNSVVTPACLQAMYGIPTTKATQTKNTIGVTGFVDEWPQTADMAAFLTKLNTAVPSDTLWTEKNVDFGVDPQHPGDAGLEANLDTQYTIGLANGVPVTYYSVGLGFTDGIEGFLDVMNFFNALPTPDNVLTTSYGLDEASISTSLANQLCDAYMAAGARGVSVLFASGDGGVAGAQSQNCTTFQPAFPSGCPFLTSVGATQNTTETAASFTSGGFSNYWTRPSYQTAAVNEYLSTLGETYPGLYNNTGRGFPDVSAQGINVEIINAGESITAIGTSCSSPIFASVIGLINDRLIAAKKPPLGFLNPFLYANPSAFTDITTGENPGCGTNGFSAGVGWDPISGLGTPLFDKLLAAAGV